MVIQIKWLCIFGTLSIFPLLGTVGCMTTGGVPLISMALDDPHTAGEFAAAAYLLARPHLSAREIEAARVVYDVFGQLVDDRRAGEGDLRGLITSQVNSNLAGNPELQPFASVAINLAWPYLMRHIGSTEIGGTPLADQEQIVSEFYGGLSTTIDSFVAAQRPVTPDGD